MVWKNVAVIGYGDAGEGGRIVDVGGGTAGVERHNTVGLSRHEIDYTDAAAGIEAALAALPAWGGEIHLYGDGVNDWEVSGGTGPGILITKPNTTLHFHGVRMSSATVTRVFIIRAPNCQIIRPWYRRSSHPQSGASVFWFEESSGSGWDCSGGAVLFGKFELGMSLAAQVSVSAIKTTGVGDEGLQGLTVLGCQFVGLPGTQQTTVRNVNNWYGFVPLQLDNVTAARIIACDFRGERTTIGTTPDGYITCGVLLRDCRYSQVLGNSWYFYDSLCVDATAGVGINTDRVASAEGHHTTVMGNQWENVRAAGFLSMLGTRFNLVAANMIGRSIGTSYGIHAGPDSQTGANGETLVLVGNQLHNVPGKPIYLEGCDDVLVAGNQGTLMHAGTRLVTVDDGCANVHVDPHSNGVRYKTPT